MTDRPPQPDHSPANSAAPTQQAFVHPSLAAGAEAVKNVLADVLGDQLISLSIVGHSLHEGLASGDLEETLALVQGDLLDAADRIGRVQARLKKARIGPPLLMTPTYIQRSLDVFPIEYLYMRLFHHTVVGPDPFNELEIKKPHVRLQCEREAKRFLLHIRQGVMRSHGDHKALRGITHELLKAAVPLFNAVLFYEGVDQPHRRSDIITRFSKDVGISAASFQLILDDVTGQTPIDNERLIRVLRDGYTVLETLSEKLDASS